MNYWFQLASCENAYFKMDNVLIDDRRIHIDFSQSVAKVKWKGKGERQEFLSGLLFVLCNSGICVRFQEILKIHVSFLFSIFFLIIINAITMCLITYNLSSLFII